MQEMAFPCFKFQKFSGGVLPQKTPPIHAWYIGHTRGIQPLLSPSNILSHRRVPFQKMPPPTGKSLKKARIDSCCIQNSFNVKHRDEKELSRIKKELNLV
jgi:hypothetical protein